MTDEELRRFFWWIDWGEPIKATFSDERGVPTGLESKLYVCRYCIAQRGLKARELKDRQGTYEEIKRHIREQHHPELPSA